MMEYDVVSFFGGSQTSSHFDLELNGLLNERAEKGWVAESIMIRRNEHVTIVFSRTKVVVRDSKVDVDELLGRKKK